MSIEKETLAELVESDFLLCQQCNQQFSNPRLLPCLHTFCETCVTKQTDAISQSKDSTDSGENIQSFVCLICKSSVISPENGATDFPLDKFLSNLVELHEYKHGKQRACEYCKFDGKKRDATSVCLDCKDDICESCAEAHRRTKITRGHLVVPLTQIQNGLYDHDIRSYQRSQCQAHADETLELFCDKCETLICGECKSNCHNNHTMLELDNAMPKYKKQMETLLTGLKSHVPSIHGYIQFLSTYLQGIEQNELSTISDIENQANLLHSIIDEQKTQMVERVSDTCKSEKAMIQDKVSNLQNAAQSLEKNAGYLQRLLSHGNAEEILSLHQQITFRLKQLVQMQLDGITQKLKLGFEARTIQKEDIPKLFGSLALGRVKLSETDTKQLMSNGELTISATTVLPNPKNSAEIMTKFEAKGKTDTKDVWPTGIAVTEANQLVIVDRDNKNIKIFTISGELLNDFSGNGDNKLGSPFDVTVLQDGNIAVTDHEKEDVKVFNLQGDHVFSIKGHFKYPRGITTGQGGEIIVVDCHLLQITIHNPKDGTLIKKITGTDADGSKVMVDPYYLTVNSNGNILVTDTAAPNIKIFTPAGKYLADYGTYGTKQDQILQPYGICSDQYGYLFVADNQNDRVHLLRPDGKFIRFLLSKSDGLWHPMAIVTSKTGEFIVTEGLGQIKLFKYI